MVEDENSFGIVMDEISETKYCKELIVYTPFNGGYSRTSGMRGGFPVYLSSDGHTVFMEEVWMFQNGLTVMAQIGSSTTHQIYPETGKNWAFFENGKLTVYENVPVWCRGT